MKTNAILLLVAAICAYLVAADSHIDNGVHRQRVNMKQRQMSEKDLLAKERIARAQFKPTKASLKERTFGPGWPNWGIPQWSGNHPSASVCTGCLWSPCSVGGTGSSCCKTGLTCEPLWQHGCSLGFSVCVEAPNQCDNLVSELIGQSLQWKEDAAKSYCDQKSYDTKWKRSVEEQGQESLDGVTA